MTPYTGDGRLPVTRLLDAFRALAGRPGWVLETVAVQRAPAGDGAALDLPIVSLRTRRTGPAFYALAGIHGEEPAGPNALARHVDRLAAFGAAFPFVLFPVCNPLGYLRDWRYPNEPRDADAGASVGDSAHLLPDPTNPSRPRRRTAACPEAAAITRALVDLARTHPPRVVIDHHEDEALAAAYVYSQGALGTADPVARRVVGLLRGSGIPVQTRGETRFGESITAGVIGPVADGSVDELLAAARVTRDGAAAPGPAARVVVVVETPTRDVPLARRIDAHAAVVGAYDELWRLAEAANG